MNLVALGDSGRLTTRLGFGCSGIMGAIGRKESLVLLETAFDAGIRHFDVAPMYGHGEAESCLGKFLTRHRTEVTVTTKYGVPPPRYLPLETFARSIARPIIKLVPGIKRRLTSVTEASRPRLIASFTAEDARKSIDASLSALGTQHIDLLLLHEATADDLTDDRLLRLLEGLVSMGTIGTFGIGSESTKIDSLVSQRPKYCRVLQYEWSVLNSEIPKSSIFRIHHRALTNNYRSLHLALSSRPSICTRWSDETGLDLANRQVLAQAMLKASLVRNPECVVLFSSRRPRNIVENVRAAENAELETPARTLHALVQTEGKQLIATVSPRYS